MTEHNDTIRFDQLPRAVGLMSRLAYAKAKAAGVALEPLLKKAGLTTYQIEHPNVRVPVRHQVKFLDLVGEALGDEFLGCHLAQLPDLRQIGLLYYCMASSDVLIDALQRGARYTSIVNEGITARLSDGAEIRIQLSYVDIGRHLDRHQIEFWMATIVRLCRDLTGHRVVPVRVRMMHLRERGCPEMADYFGDNIEYGAVADEIAFSKRSGELPLASADPYLNTLLVRYCEEGIARRQIHRGSFRARVRKRDHSAAAAWQGQSRRDRTETWSEPTHVGAAARFGGNDVFKPAGRIEDRPRTSLSRGGDPADFGARLAAGLSGGRRVLPCLQALDRQVAARSAFRRCGAADRARRARPLPLRAQRHVLGRAQAKTCSSCSRA